MISFPISVFCTTFLPVVWGSGAFFQSLMPLVSPKNQTLAVGALEQVGIVDESANGRRGCLEASSRGTPSQGFSCRTER